MLLKCRALSQLHNSSSSALGIFQFCRELRGRAELLLPLSFVYRIWAGGGFAAICLEFLVFCLWAARGARAVHKPLWQDARFVKAAHARVPGN